MKKIQWISILIIILVISIGLFIFKSNNRNEQTLINTPVTESSVRVLLPNGGEVYKVGNDLEIKWWDDNDAGNRDIYITDLQHIGTEIAIRHNVFMRSSGINGNYLNVWKISDMPTGKYKIQVCKSGTKECDFSDDFFMITE